MHVHAPIGYCVCAVLCHAIQVPCSDLYPYRCDDADCRKRGCLGNRLERLTEVYSSSSPHVSLQPSEAAFTCPPAAAAAAAVVLQPPSSPRLHARVAALFPATPAAAAAGGQPQECMSDEEMSFHSCAEGEEPAAAAAVATRDDACSSARTASPEPAPLLHMLKVVLVHHKNEKEWGKKPITYIIPYDQAVWLEEYLQRVWPRLRLGSSHSRLFAQWNGNTMELSEHLCNEWHAVQVRNAAAWPSFPPKSLRDIHVQFKIKGLAAAVASGGGEVAVAGDGRVMGNTAKGRTWVNNYSKGTYWSTMAQAAVDALTLWRRNQQAAWLQTS